MYGSQAWDIVPFLTTHPVGPFHARSIFGPQAAPVPVPRSGAAPGVSGGLLRTQKSRLDLARRRRVANRQEGGGGKRCRVDCVLQLLTRHARAPEVDHDRREGGSIVSRVWIDDVRVSLQQIRPLLGSQQIARSSILVDPLRLRDR